MDLYCREIPTVLLPTPYTIVLSRNEKTFQTMSPDRRFIIIIIITIIIVVVVVVVVAVVPHESLLNIVKRPKLQWYGHVSNSSGLAKTILQGTVAGGRRQGRQRKKLEDNIRE